jgi:hypothetical protein
VTPRPTRLRPPPRDFADLYLLVPGDLRETEVIEALRVVGSHQSVALRPLGEVLAGMAVQAQARWATWRRRQGLEERVPEDFGDVLDAHTRACPLR